MSIKYIPLGENYVKGWNRDMSSRRKRTDVKFMNVKEKLIMHLKINSGWQKFIIILIFLRNI